MNVFIDAFAEMHGADWILIVATFLACFAGSALGAWMTNRHSRKLDQKQLEREKRSRHEREEHERRIALTRIHSSYDNLLTRSNFENIKSELRSKLENPSYEAPSDHARELSNQISPLSQEMRLYIDCSDDNPRKDRISKEFEQLDLAVSTFLLIADSPSRWKGPGMSASMTKEEHRAELLKDLESHWNRALGCSFNLRGSLDAYDEEYLLKYSE